MYKFTSTLTDSPWIDQFREQSEATTRWKANPANSVLLLKSDLKKQGVEDAKKIETVGTVEQTTQQALAELTRQIAEKQPIAGEPQTKQKKKINSISARKTAARATTRANDIFTKYKESKRYKN